MTRRAFIPPARCYFCGRFLSRRLERYRARWHWPKPNSTEYVFVCDTHKDTPA